MVAPFNFLGILNTIRHTICIFIPVLPQLMTSIKQVKIESAAALRQEAMWLGDHTGQKLVFIPQYK